MDTFLRVQPMDFERKLASLLRRLYYELCARKTQVHSMPMFTALPRRDITKSWHRLPTILATYEFSRVLNRYIMYFLYLYMLKGQIYRLLSNTIYEEFILMMPTLWKSNCKLPNPWGQQGRWWLCLAIGCLWWTEIFLLLLLDVTARDLPRLPSTQE